MNPGLRYLLRASWRGALRRLGRRMRTVGGASATLFGALFLLFVVFAQVMAVLDGAGRPRDHDATVMGAALALTLLLVSALATADAPFFWPQEVQFLFPAPLTRGELLLYQLLRGGALQAFSGLWIGAMTLQFAAHPLGALVAGSLGMLYVFALTQLAGLVKVAAGDRLPRALRAAGKPALALGAGAVAWVLYRRVQADGLAQALESGWMRIATLPARPFGEVFAARSWVEGLAWACLCAALIAAAAAASLLLPGDFRERSLVSSARRFERLRRMRTARSGYASSAAPVRRRLVVPSLAFLGPAAPLARRQVYELGRGLRVLWGLIFTAGLAFFYVVVMPGMFSDRPAGPAGASLAALVVVFPLLGSGAFSIDFRRDVERMAYLRSLPLPPMAVAVGQVFTAAAVVAALNLALLAGAAALADGRVEPGMAAVAAGVAVPVAWLAVTLENWLFLLFPTRVQADGMQQNAFVGKQIVKLLFKMGLLLLVGAVAGAAALAGGWLAGRWGAAAAGALTVLLACAGATALLARAFHRFDLTVDSPA